MGQDEGRGPDRVDQDLVGRGQAVQDQADREVVGQDPVGDRVDRQISDSLDVARAVPPRESRARCACHNNEGRCKSSSSFGLPSPY